MKIVQISVSYVGAQKIIERAIHKELILQGHNSVVLYSDGQADEKEILCYDSNVSSLFRRILRKVFGKNPKFAFLSTKRLIRKIKSVNPDIVHLHTIHHGYIDYELLFNFLIDQKIPVVYTAHDMWLYTGGCYYYTKENCDKFQTGCNDCPATIERLDNYVKDTSRHYALKKQLFSKLSQFYVVAVSKWVEEEAKKGFLANYPITVIENGIDPVVLKNEISLSFSKKKHTKLLCVAAVWNERKGINRILEMAQILGDDYHFYLIGGAKQDLKDLAPENVHFLGYVRESEKLNSYYSAADLYVSASFEETFGMTFVEAAFLGTRSIGYASTAVKNTLNGVNGIAVEEFNSKAMCDEIINITKSKSMKLSKLEKDQVIQKYSSKSMAKKYCELYEVMLQNKSEGK